MKPTNKKEYNRSILGFFAMWAITTALIVFACLQPFKTPKLENIKLRKQVADLKADSLQQHLLFKTIRGIDSTMIRLEKEEVVKPNTLKKLRSYPTEDFADTQMKEELTVLSERIASIYESSNMSGGDLQKQLKDCNDRMVLKDEQINNLNILIQQKESQINQLRYLNSQ